uniref:Uncharacterized protein n=1 Tax=Oryza nivara TaxID=4536 RepID=A0A0E0J0M9_ORYNI
MTSSPCSPPPRRRTTSSSVLLTAVFALSPSPITATSAHHRALLRPHHHHSTRASVAPAHLPSWGSTATTRKRQDVAEASQLRACPATVAMLLATVVITFFTNLSILSNLPHRAAAASSSSPPPLPSSFPGGYRPCPAPPPLAVGRAHHLPSRPSVVPSCYPTAHARCTMPNCSPSMSPVESG